MSAGVCRAAAIALTGVEGTTVMVEAAVSNQLPGIAIIGLPDTALAEARLRVRSATAQSGLPLSSRFITLNLSPASLPKHGSSFDLAIALAACAASGHLPSGRLPGVAHIGELSLSGDLRRPAGLLSSVMAARSLGYERVMVPLLAAEEAALVPGVEVIAVSDLRRAVEWYRGDPTCATVLLGGEHGSGAASASLDRDRPGAPDMSDVIGQPEASRAMEIAAAGRHHISLLGPPGAGKTLLATALPSILPDLDDDEALTASSIASLGGAPLSALVRRPPFESPHHTASKVSMIGGGQSGAVRPGAITHACHGLLFLDEAPEFPKGVLDALRQPLESGVIDIHRAQVRTTLPAKFQLVLAANPCPCGNAGSPETALECRCSPSVRMRYLQRLSGPLTDRIDMRVTVRRVSSALLRGAGDRGTTSAGIRERVSIARAAAAERLRDTEWSVNSEVPRRHLMSPGMRLPRGDTAVVDRALNTGALTMRGYARVLRIGWSIADLEGLDRPRRNELAEALELRGGDGA